MWGFEFVCLVVGGLELVCWMICKTGGRKCLEFICLMTWTCVKVKQVLDVVLFAHNVHMCGDVTIEDSDEAL